MLTTFFVPSEGDKFTQTFLSYRPDSRAQIALAYIWRTEDIRLLGNYVLIPEGQTTPSVTGGFAFQSTFDNRVAPFLTASKQFHFGSSGSANITHAELYTGLSRRPNESHLHGLTGAKISFACPVYLGFQHTGHDVNYYFGWSFDMGTVSVWLAEGKKPGLLLTLWRH